MMTMTSASVTTPTTATQGNVHVTGRLRAVLGPVWRDRRIAVGVAVLVAGGYGLLAAWWTPRGPVTTSQAVTAIVIGLVVGAVAGLVLRSRWAMLLGPITFIAVFELARMGTAGPMVDGIHLGSMYGIIAFALGRGLHPRPAASTATPRPGAGGLGPGCGRAALSPRCSA
jgi:proline iminopeptidase